MDISNSSNFLYREIVKKIEPWVERDEIIVILGARQVGKTSLLKLFQHQLESSGRKTYFIDLEDIEIRNSLKNARDLIAYIGALGWSKNEKIFLFLDEIHYLDNCTSILKYLHDHHPEIKIFVTGSSSLRLKFKMSEPLTGRKVVFILYPLSFTEFLLFSGKNDLYQIIKKMKGQPIPEPLRIHIRDAYEEYIIYGGYPKVALTPAYQMKLAVLKEIQTTYLEKEIRGLIGDNNFSKFRTFVEYIAVQNGGLVKVLEISKEVGIARNTVARYLTILEETFIIKTLRPLARSRSKEVIKMPKVYFLDTGFLNYTLKSFQNLSLRPNAGILIESAIYTNLLKNLKDIEDLRYWRTKTGEEVDFILRRNTNYIPIEIKYSEYPKISDGLRKFMKKFNLRKGYLVCKTAHMEERINNGKIIFLPPWAIEFELW